MSILEVEEIEIIAAMDAYLDELGRQKRSILLERVTNNTNASLATKPKAKQPAGAAARGRGARPGAPPPETHP